LLKQARAFGVGVVVASQNPMDLDYRALGNAGIWCVGRLQTDADRERVIDGLAASIADERAALSALARTVQRLAPRWFVIRDAHVANGVALLQPRWAMSLLRGPMTRAELKRAREAHARVIEGRNTLRAASARLSPAVSPVLPARPSPAPSAASLAVSPAAPIPAEPEEVALSAPAPSCEQALAAAAKATHSNSIG
jgi:hypothetical protein